MIQELNFNIPELNNMRKYPKELFYIGNIPLLKKKKVSIIGTRRPNSYTKEFTHKLASNVTYKNKLKYTTTNLNGII